MKCFWICFLLEKVKYKQNYKLDTNLTFTKIGDVLVCNQTIFLDNYLLLGKIRFMQFYVNLKLSLENKIWNSSF